MKKNACFLLLLCSIFHFAHAQENPQELNVPKVRYAPVENWKGFWITHPAIGVNDYNVVLFRKTFELAAKPAEFIVNVTADNHYTLYVNGRRVCFGPQVSDPQHWRYETLDLAPFLKTGKNIVAAEVVNWGYERFYGIISHATGFLMNGISPAAAVVNTDGNTWRTTVNRGYNYKKVHWWGPQSNIIGGFYANNPTDSIRAEAHPWGWEQTQFDDNRWATAIYLAGARSVGTGSLAWFLEPRTVPLEIEKKERLARVAKSTLADSPVNFLKGGSPLTLAAHTKATLLLDNSILTIGYPELVLSGGKDARVQITYAENLFLPDKQKGNRNEIEGKRMIGIQDVIVPDGGKQRVFRPTWRRTFRYVQLDIQTQAEPLVIEDYYNIFIAAPVEKKADFQSSDPMHAKIMDICWRTSYMCTQDVFLSDAYYETMQYVGDTKVHALVHLALTGDDLHVRNALQQFHYSRLWDGNLTSCYPVKATFGHATYSLIWIDMLYDYLQYRGDEAFIRSFMPGVHAILQEFDTYMKPDGLAGDTPWKYFVDWYSEGRKGGTAPGSENGNSTVVTLHYIYTLQNAARLCELFGQKHEAEQYRKRAEEIKKKVYELCFDAQRGIFAEHPQKDFWDQRGNIMAVLTDAVPADQQKALLQKVLTDKTLSQAGYYYRFYYFEALKKTGAAELFDTVLEPWRGLVNLGLTTTLERPDAPPNVFSRSECHPWSASPAYAYLYFVAGIGPGEPGFRSVRMVPQLGGLSFIKGKYPHPSGLITFDLKKSGKDGLKGFVELPAGLTGTFVWRGKEIPLRGGRQEIKF